MNYKRENDVNIPQFKSSNYDLAAVQSSLLNDQRVIEESINTFLAESNIEGACGVLEFHISEAHKNNKLKQRSTPDEEDPTMKNTNDLFDSYLKTLADNKDQAEIDLALLNYTNSRKNVSARAISTEAVYWDNVLSACDTKRLWSCIDWKNNNRKRKNQQAQDT